LHAAGGQRSEIGSQREKLRTLRIPTSNF
jgi:hypothetical protein